jgi:hypothetical protein
VAAKWLRPKPSLQDVLANVASGRHVRLHLSPDQREVLNDRDGQLARQVVRALLRARHQAAAPGHPRDSFPLTEHAFQAVAHRLGYRVGIKRARRLIHRLTAAEVIAPDGSYRQRYRTTGVSGYRVKLYRIGVRITGLRITGLRGAATPQPPVGTSAVVKRGRRVPWWQHGLFGNPDGLPPPGLTARTRRWLALEGEVIRTWR